jgi:hypothetical protein
MDKGQEITDAPDDPSNAETYAVALRIAAKLMAFKALKRSKLVPQFGANWLNAATAAELRADEYEFGVESSMDPKPMSKVRT